MPRPRYLKRWKAKKFDNAADKDDAKSVATANAGEKAPNTKSRAAAQKKVKKSFAQKQNSVGLLVTEELEAAIARCTAKVNSISRHCRARNKKFRDPEFDLSNDREMCLQGLDDPEGALNPTDVMRVTDIWDNPQFFIDGSSSSDVEQGTLGDCWFLSALANVASVPGLLEKVCVARDEPIGVYGFIFFRDHSWVDVIIDDQLFVNVPKFESLTPDEQRLYHGDPYLYNSIARKGNKIFYFAMGKTDGETWVPLIEKAYAKLHGNYTYLSGGFSMEGIEDLTGGVCSSISMVDIFDKEEFWKELSQNANRTRLYSCFLSGVDDERSFSTARTINGLITMQAYTVLRAVEFNGKKFVVVRNPWRTGEWKGRWYDGSKEWTAEWLPLLTTLDHSFGDDGQFVMESWASSNIWVQIDGVSPLHPWAWGDVSYTISVPKNTPAVIVLQQVDSTYFEEISGYRDYNFDFVIFKKGSNEVIASCMGGINWCRSRSVEVNLEAGEYVVHVRLDSMLSRDSDYFEEGISNWDPQVLKRILAKKAEAYSKASMGSAWEDVVPTTLEALGGHDLTELEIKLVEAKRQKKLRESAEAGDGGEGDGEDEDEAEEEEEEAEEDTDDKGPATHDGISCDIYSDACPNFDLCQECFDKKEHNPEHTFRIVTIPDVPDVDEEETDERPSHVGVYCDECGMNPIIGPRFKCMDSSCPSYDLCEDCVNKGIHPPNHQMLRLEAPDEAQHLHPGVSLGSPLVLGLRVYTLKSAVTVLGAQLKHGSLKD
ncbi:cysteine proteinase [Serendipita vermifera]|nr:cysteine proteinase [Serendipita vermifera]